VPSPQGPESRDQVADHRSWLRVPDWRARLSRHKDIAVLALGVVAAGVSALVGIVHLGWGWIFAAVCAAALVAALATRALNAKKAEDRKRSLWAALGVACAIPVVAYSYHQWWDPARQANQIYQVVVGGPTDGVFHPYDYPGATQEDFVYSPVLSQSTIDLECYVTLPASGVWYRILNNGGWIPRDFVYAIPGLAFPNPPQCHQP
jgi:hypothetical protein